MIDLYCERLDSSFWAEPINALTNLVFIIAAWTIWKHGHRLGKLSNPIWVLIGLMVSIGIGSFLFHTYPTDLTKLLDILPILLFQFVWFVFLYCPFWQQSVLLAASEKLDFVFLHDNSALWTLAA